MRKYFLATALVACFSCANAQTYDMTVPQPSYSDATGYGWDVVEAPTAKELKTGLSRPVFFSVKVPDGNYKVTVTIGSKKHKGNTGYNFRVYYRHIRNIQHNRLWQLLH